MLRHGSMEMQSYGSFLDGKLIERLFVAGKSPIENNGRFLPTASGDELTVRHLLVISLPDPTPTDPIPSPSVLIEKLPSLEFGSPT